MAKYAEPTWVNLKEFVEEGVMLAMPLCFPGQSVPPPSGETAITVMAFDSNRSLYLGTAGKKAHILVGAIFSDTGVVHDMAVVPGADAVTGIAVEGDVVYAIGAGEGGSAVWKCPRFAPRFLIQEWGADVFKRHNPEKVCDLFSDQKVACSIFTLPGPTFYGITEPKGELFMIDVSSQKKPTIIGSVLESKRFGRAIVRDNAGRLWGSRGWGKLWVCDPSNGRIDDVGDMPVAAGRSQHTLVSAWAMDDLTGMLYGGTSPDGILFRLNPETHEIVSLGKPTRVDAITCLVIGNDGRVFGMTGEEDDVSHMFVYDPQVGSLRDLGVPISALTSRQYGYHFRCAIAGKGGEIYFGQHERVNYLWVYLPPIPARKAAPTA